MSHALQVYLDDSDFQALDAWVRERGCTLSQAVRLALRALTHQAGADPLLAASGMVDGLPSDLSQRFDDYLANTYASEPLATYVRTKPKRPRARKAVRR